MLCLLGELEKPESASQDKQTASSLKHFSLQFDWLINHVFLEWLLISFIPKLDWLIDYRLLLEWLLTYIYLYIPISLVLNPKFDMLKSVFLFMDQLCIDDRLIVDRHLINGRSMVIQLINCRLLAAKVHLVPIYYPLVIGLWLLKYLPL